MSEKKQTEKSSRNTTSLIGGPRGGGPGHFRMNEPVAKPRNRTAVIGRLWEYLKPYTAKLTVLGLLVATVTGLQLGGPYLQGLAIDNAIVPGNLSLLLKYLIALVGLYALISGLSLIQQWSMVQLGQDLIKRIRGELFSKIQFLPLKYHDTNPHGDTMSRVTNDVDTVNQTVTSSLPQIITSVLTIIGVIIMMYIANWRMATVTLITIPLVALIARKIATRSRSAFKSQRKGIGKLNGTIEESISGLKAIILFRHQKETLEQFDTENHDVRVQTVRAQILGGIMGPIMGLLRNFNFAVVVLAGAFFSVRGLVSIGVVVTFLLYARLFTRPLNEIAQLYNTIQSALAGAERIFEAMDQEPEPEDSGSIPLSDGKKLVEFKNVSFSYIPGQPVLRSVNITAGEGQTVALVGPTGAGKTTIINLLARFYDIDEGVIRVDNRDITEIPRDSLRRSLGVVLQDTFLFSDTVMENIRYGRLDATDEEVMAAARMAYADHFIVHLPRQYQTTLTE